jgi:hypothetical protein
MMIRLRVTILWTNNNAQLGLGFDRVLSTVFTSYLPYRRRSNKQNNYDSYGTTIVARQPTPFAVIKF